MEGAFKLLDHIGDAKCVGINGLDCSGKTTLANELLAAYGSRGIEANLLHVDDFNDLAVQNRVYSAFITGDFSPALFEEYYQSSVNYAALGDTIERHKQQSKDILIVEGVFLFRSSLADMFDYKIFIDVDPPIACERYAVRKKAAGDTRPIEVFNEIWLPAFECYCAEVQPAEIADTVLKA